MINLDMGGNGDTHAVTDETISEAIKVLDNPYQKVKKCLFCYQWIIYLCR